MHVNMGHLDSTPYNAVQQVPRIMDSAGTWKKIVSRRVSRATKAFVASFSVFLELTAQRQQ